ncbi:MAG: rod shape-determining protein MreD [Actinomycetota bacterium]
MKVFLKVLHFLMLVMALVLQLSFAEYLKFYSINLDLVMICVVSVAIVDGYLYGVAYGFIFGLLLDLMGGDIAGINAFIYALNAFIAARFMEMGIKRKYPLLLLIIFFITEINLLLEALLLYLFNFNINIVELGREMLLKPVYSILFTIMIFPLFNLGQKERWEFGFQNKEKD